MKSTIFSTKIPNELLEKLRREAKIKYTSVGSIIKRLIVEYYEKNKRTHK